jgi:hypothetical protein
VQGGISHKANVPGVAHGHALANEATLDGGPHSLGRREKAVPVTLQQEQPLQRIRTTAVGRYHASMRAWKYAWTSNCMEEHGRYHV